MKHGIIKNIPDNPKEILDYALSKCFKTWVDEKGTKKHPGHWSREKSDLSFEEAFDIIQNNSPHWVFSFRNHKELFDNDDFWDFGGCNMGGNDGIIYIWIYVSVEDAEEIFKKFNLETKYY